MDIKISKEYKLFGERNNKPRQPLICEDKIFLIFNYDKKGFTEGKIQCLSLNNFEPIWEFQISHVINNILISSNRTLIASGMNGIVWSLSLEKGEVVWEFKTDAVNLGPVSNEICKTIVFSGIHATESSTWCIDIETGNLVWKQANSGHSYIPKVHNEYVFNCIGNDLFCLSLQNGAVLWSQKEPATFMFNPKVFRENIITAGHGIVNSYNQQTGNLVMRIETGEKSSIREIISDNENIYFGDDKGYFYSYNLSQSTPILNWKITTGGSIQTIPAIKDQTIYVINDSCKLLCIDKSNGEIENEMKIKGEGNISGITIHDNKIYFSCGGGYLYECEEK